MALIAIVASPPKVASHHGQRTTPPRRRWRPPRARGVPSDVAREPSLVDDAREHRKRGDRDGRARGRENAGKNLPAARRARRFQEPASKPQRNEKRHRHACERDRRRAARPTARKCSALNSTPTREHVEPHAELRAHVENLQRLLREKARPEPAEKNSRAATAQAARRRSFRRPTAVADLRPSCRRCGRQ